MKIILTPINLISPSTINGIKARQDYLREQSLFTLGTPKWDDTRYNKACVGDKFGFVNQIEDKIEIFEILRIQPCTERPDYWNIEEHRKRNVLYLSNLKEVKTFSGYLEECNYKPTYRIIGTCHGKWNL